MSNYNISKLSIGGDTFNLGSSDIVTISTAVDGDGMAFGDTIAQPW